MFYKADKPFVDVKKEAVEAVLQTGQLATVEKAEIYNGSTSIITVYGKNNDGTDTAVFYQKDASTYEEVSLKDGVSAEAALEKVQRDGEVKKVLHVTLGIEEELPVWEIAYKNNSNNLNYVYVLFEDGEWWKRILNL